MGQHRLNGSGARKFDIRRVVLFAAGLIVLVAAIMGYDYIRTDRDRKTAAALMETGKRIDFNPGSAFVYSTGETIQIPTLDRSEQAGPRTAKVFFRSPWFGFEMILIYQAGPSTKI